MDLLLSTYEKETGKNPCLLKEGTNERLPVRPLFALITMLPHQAIRLVNGNVKLQHCFSACDDPGAGLENLRAGRVDPSAGHACHDECRASRLLCLADLS